MTRRVLFALLVSAWGCQPQECPQGPKSDASPAASSERGADEAAAVALFDQATKAGLRGDEIEKRRLMTELAARHPETRHGQAAQRRLSGINPALIGGTMAAVAIPAFLRYVHRAKFTEAQVNLERLAQSAQRYYSQDHIGPNGKLTAPRFPQSTPLTPAAALCSLGEKYPPTAGDWSAAGWRELEMTQTEPHYFQYRFTSTGEGPTATFKVEAIGDLDCDGTTSHSAIDGVVENGEVRLIRQYYEDLE